MDGHQYSLLKKLQEGDESRWEYISNAVDRGEIPRPVALGALEECLKHQIPHYQHNVDTREQDPEGGEGFGYWHGKLSEAVKTIRKIKEVVRGHEPNIIYKGKTI